MTPCGFRDHAEQRVKRIERCKTRRNSPALKNSHILRKNNLTIPPTDPCHKHQGKQRTSTRKTGVSACFSIVGSLLPSSLVCSLPFANRRWLAACLNLKHPTYPPTALTRWSNSIIFPNAAQKKRKKHHTLSPFLLTLLAVRQMEKIFGSCRVRKMICGVCLREYCTAAPVIIPIRLCWWYL